MKQAVSTFKGVVIEKEIEKIKKIVKKYEPIDPRYKYFTARISKISANGILTITFSKNINNGDYNLTLINPESLGVYISNPDVNLSNWKPLSFSKNKLEIKLNFSNPIKIS